jgi:hypothetical protein
MVPIIWKVVVDEQDSLRHCKVVENDHVKLVFPSAVFVAVCRMGRNSVTVS